MGTPKNFAAPRELIRVALGLNPDGACGCGSFAGMDGRPVTIRIAGQSCKVISSAGEEELQRLADTVTAKVEELTPRGRAVSPDAVLLAAIALAHDLEQERTRRLQVERRTKEMLRRILGRIDDALDDVTDG